MQGLLEYQVQIILDIKYFDFGCISPLYQSVHLPTQSIYLTCIWQPNLNPVPTPLTPIRSIQAKTSPYLNPPPNSFHYRVHPTLPRHSNPPILQLTWQTPSNTRPSLYIATPTRSHTFCDSGFLLDDVTSHTCMHV